MFLGMMGTLLSLFACGSARVLAEGDVDDSLSIKSVIRKHEAGDVNFKTLSGRLGIDYSDGEEAQRVTVSLRMKRDEVIWLSAPLGVIKVLITPDRVSFYNKLNDAAVDAWSRQWKATFGTGFARQSGIWFPSPSPGMTGELLKDNRVLYKSASVSRISLHKK